MTTLRECFHCQGRLERMYEKAREQVELENKLFVQAMQKSQEVRKWVKDYSHRLEKDILQEEVRERWLYER